MIAIKPPVTKHMHMHNYKQKFAALSTSLIPKKAFIVLA